MRSLARVTLASRWASAIVLTRDSLLHYGTVTPLQVLCKDPANPLPGQEAPKPTSIPIQGIEEWEVQESLGSKLVRRQLKYCTSWVGHNLDPCHEDATSRPFGTR